ncbi:unnamed protein product [Rhizophagus irregularis]|nr:unnamed protein product [Rhizophagus irregularis]
MKLPVVKPHLWVFSVFWKKRQLYRGFHFENGAAALNKLCNMRSAAQSNDSSAAPNRRCTQFYLNASVEQEFDWNENHSLDSTSDLRCDSDGKA